ncbi:MAG: hypothetical protein QW273_00440 [Candidatus Pacearchaeota archaeon]
MKKRAQLTLFIILGILIFFAIVFFLIYIRKSEMFITQEQNIEACFSNNLQREIKFLSFYAGLINPKFNYNYSGKIYPILCYTEEYLKPCVNQEPFLKDAFENSLKERIKEDFEKCFKDYADDLKKRGFDVEEGKISFDLKIEPEEVVVLINAPTIIKKGDQSSQIRKFSYRYKTRLYDVIMIATSLIQYETYYGDSEQMQQMFFYPNIKIIKTRTENGIKTYSIIEKEEDIEFNFAVRSYAFPPGGVI